MLKGIPDDIAPRKNPASEASPVVCAGLPDCTAAPQSSMPSYRRARRSDHEQKLPQLTSKHGAGGITSWRAQF